ncbi:hypothetical protein M9Y10_029396 [Tritrichomonas musculus]|uniref:RWD domain-containing protein n=1 Tax=Tritrichomonas musculus TaxID=1915356 RepID=A0ABR2KMY4_9EUKA
MTAEDHTYKELNRVAENLKFVQEKLSLNNPISTDLISSNNKLNARLNLDQGFYECNITVRFSTETDNEQNFQIKSYPIPEFHSMLSIICPLIPKIEYLSSKSEFLTSQITKDIIQDLRMCEEILTVRPHLTNSECCPDWNEAFSEESSKNPDLFISVFPFRDALYVTVYQVKKTPEKPVCELHNSPEPFSFASNSVIKINGNNYTVLHSIVAKQSQQFLAQTLRWIRDSIEELETLTALKSKNEMKEQDE